MSRTLTWEFLTPVHVHRVLTAPDSAAVRRIIAEADEESAVKYLPGTDDEERREIMIDFLYHILRFSKSRNFTAEKVSALTSIAFHTHSDSMSKRATMQESYQALESYLVCHSVHRPPYSSAVFAVDDVKHINDYLLSTYYRHYKYYFYAFTPRTEATLVSTIVSPLNECPPNLVPLNKAVPLQQWDMQQAELARKRDEERAREDAAAAAVRAEEEARRKAQAHAEEERGPEMTQGLRAQLSMIRGNVTKMSTAKLDELEAKIIAMENKLAENTKPNSSMAGRAGRPSVTRK